MNRSRAFTFVEILVVTTIIAVLVGLTMPAIRAARRSAQISASVSNVRQMHLATKSYQADWDGDGIYGDIGDMGLPPALFVIRNRFETPLEMWASPCGDHPSLPPTVIDYLYWPGDGGEAFRDHAVAYRENLVIFSDMNCTDPSVSVYNHYRLKRGIGVLLSGQLVNHLRIGDHNNPNWWAPPAP